MEPLWLLRRIAETEPEEAFTTASLLLTDRSGSNGQTSFHDMNISFEEATVELTDLLCAGLVLDPPRKRKAARAKHAAGASPARR